MTEKNYPWKMTGDAWLDGIIYGSGVPHTKAGVWVRVNDLPIEIIEKILNIFKKLKYQADYIEIPNSITRKLDLRIEAIGPSPIFGELPRISERRLFDGMPFEFLNGFFTAISVPSLKEYSGKLKKDGIFIKFPMPFNDLLYFLGKLGVKEYETWQNQIFLDIDIIQNLAPFEEIYQKTREEISSLEKNLSSKEQEWDKLMNRADEKKHILSVDDLLVKKKIVITLLDNWCIYFRDDKNYNFDYVFIDKFKDVLKKEFKNNSNEIINDFHQGCLARVISNDIITKKDLAKMIQVYKKQILQLCRQSFKFHIFIGYLDYLKEKQTHDPDYLISPKNLSQNTGLGNLKLAKHFIINILEGELSNEKDGGYYVTLISEKDDEVWEEIIIENTDFFSKESMKFFPFESANKFKNNIYAPMQVCHSCYQPLVLFSGEICNICTIGLCLDCFEKYRVSKNNKTQFFCKNHYLDYMNKSKKINEF